MAAFNGLNYTKAFVNVPSEKIAPGEISGEIKVAYDEITFAQNVIAIGDTVNLGIVLPAGARVLEAVVVSPSLGTTGIFDLGTAADPDALIVGADAGGQAVKALTTAAAADLGKELTVETRYILTFTEATTAANGVKVFAYVKYVTV